MPRPTHQETSYLPALDGLRALAVVFVVLYHLGVPGFGGGLLGVGMFFTLSGFLITSLLIFTKEKTGGLGLKTFWIRRFRRLMPAVVLVLLATLVTAAITVPRQFVEYLWEALSALFYVNNWYTIFTDTSYFDRFEGPSPLSHMWSLSIEEQFYLIWPLLLALMYLVIRRRIGLTIVTVALALASFWLLYDLAEQAFDNTRAYEGTDTRAGGLLLGAAMAFWWPARKQRVGHALRCWLDVLALAGLAVIVLLVEHTDDNSMSLYSWGLLALTLATMAILAAAVAPQTLVATLLSLAPLRWIGERSYGIYLWHMPVVAFLPLAVRTDSPWFGSIVAIAITLLLATVSWKYVEDPIRRRGFVAVLTGRADERAAPPAVGVPAGPSDTPVADASAAVSGFASEPHDHEARPILEHPVDLSGVLSARPGVAPELPDDDEESGQDGPAADGESDADTQAPETGHLAAAPGAVAPEPVETGAEPVAEAVADAGADSETETAASPPAPEPGEDLPDTVRAAPRIVVPDPRPTAERRRLLRPLGTVVGVLTLAVMLMLGTHSLSPDMAVVRALSTGHDDEFDDPTADEPTTEPVGPTLAAAQRRTTCDTVIHVGDSTSIGMNDPGMQPVPADRITEQYRRAGAGAVYTDIVGGRSSIERLNGEPNVVESIRADRDRGWKGCWVINMGINDTANIEVGGPGPIDMRIDLILDQLKDQQVLWPTVITNRLNQNPAYNNRAMKQFNRALIRACERHPNLRVYDLAGETDDAWFADGVHYTAAGNAQRARLLSTAVATVYPADDLAPKGCLLRSVEAVEPPADQQR
ncbi:acyltransferase family protein [Gordonia iterans]